MDRKAFRPFVVDAANDTQDFCYHFPTRWGAAAAHDIFVWLLKEGPGVKAGTRTNFKPDLPWHELIGIMLAGANDRFWDDEDTVAAGTIAKATVSAKALDASPPDDDGEDAQLPAQPTAPAPAQPAAATGGGRSIRDSLLEIKQWRSDGIIDEEDYKTWKMDLWVKYAEQVG